MLSEYLNLLDTLFQLKGYSITYEAIRKDKLYKQLKE